MKLLKAVVIPPMIFVISTNIISCNKNIPAIVNNTVVNTTEMSFLHESTKLNVDISSPVIEDSTENIIELIDARILWIKEHLNSFICIEESNEDYYDGNYLVCRRFYQYLDSQSLSSSADVNSYTLYYDEHENLIYADIIRYRGPLYSIYIQDNELLHVEVGPFSSERGTYVNGNIADVEKIIKEDAYFIFILEDIAICLENAH